MTQPPQSDPSQFGPQWTTPPPPPHARAGMRARRVWAGIGIALLGHVVVIVVPLAIGSAGIGGALWTWLALFGELALFVACLTVGIVLITRRERGIGLGLLIGWPVGVVITFGVCVYAFAQIGSG